MIGRQQVDLDFFRRALRLTDAAPEQHRAHIYAAVEAMTAHETQGQIHDDANVLRLCRLGGVSRAGYYRHFEMSAPARADTELRDRSRSSASGIAATATGGSPRNCDARARSSTPSACCG